MILPTPGIGNSHPKGAQYLYSGEAPDGRVDMPDIGSVVTAQMGTEALYLLSNIMLPGTSEMANMTSVGFLPPGYACFKTGGSPANSNWKVPNLGLLAGIDGLHRSGAIGPAGRHESARPLGRNAALLRDRIRAHAENQRASGGDHWANAFSFAFAGVPGGPVVGSTVKEGGYVTSSIAYTLEVYAATIYDKLGIDHSKPIHMPSGRPIYLAAKGKPIPELF